MPLLKAKAVFGGQAIYTEDTSNERSPLITANRERSRTITRELILHAPEDIETLLNECFPQFSPPGRHPSNQLFFAENVSIRPKGRARDFAETPYGTNLGYVLHGNYSATVSYGGLDYDPEEEDAEGQPNAEQNLSVSIDTTGQYEIVPSGSLFWGDGKKIDDSISAGITLVADTKYALTKVNASFNSIPHVKSDEMIGQVNSIDFATDHFAFPGCDSQTLLYTGMQWSWTSDTFGGRNYTYTLNFWKRTRFAKGKGDLGWNYFYDPTQKTYRQAFTDPAAGAGNLVYGTFTNNDLRELLGVPIV